MSHGMISCYTDDMLYHAKELWGNKMNNSFPLQVDETSDFIGKCHVIVSI